MLADHAGLVPRVARWLYREWWRDLGDTPRGAEQRLRRRLHQDWPPLALVALADDEPIGTASIVHDNHPLAPGLVCCVAGLYVHPDWRCQGVGAALCRCAILLAEKLHLPPLALFTKDAETFYRRLGWANVCDTVVQAGRSPELAAFMEWQGPLPAESCAPISRRTSEPSVALPS